MSKRPSRLRGLLLALFVLCGLFILGPLLPSQQAAAQGDPTPFATPPLAPSPTPDNGTVPPIQVGLVMQGPGGVVSTYCLSLPADKNTGLDALYTTALDVNVQAGPLGAAVCRVGTAGCNYPAQACFCQCQGAECSYWAYFFQVEPGQWQYSSLGVSTRRLKQGDVEGWLWSEGRGQTPSGQLPPLTFERICAAPNSAPGEQSGTATAAAPEPLTLLGYGLLIALVLIGGGVLLWRRRTSR